MQISFFDPTEDEISPQTKGHIFEQFAKRLVEYTGHRDVVLRVKRSSLEYDVEARSSLNGRQLNGEAKAHEAAISGKEVTAFFGKLVPLAHSSQNGLDGLFISTSRLTPDGEDFLRDLTPEVLSGLRMTFTTLVGEKIPQFLSERGHCASEESIKRTLAADTRLHPNDSWLVLGRRGDIIIVSAGPSAASAATHFVGFDLAGHRCVLTNDDVRRLRRQLVDLSNLTYLPPDEMPAPDISTPSLPGVLAGAGWFDYKFPSPPDCFVGRDTAIAAVQKFIQTVAEGATTLRAIQILSRSGVGKSSLLLKIGASSDETTQVSATVDGRNLLAPGDLRLVVAALLRTVQDAFEVELPVPSRQEDALTGLEKAAQELALRSRVALVQIDQFEALLGRPDVFRTFLDLVAATTDRALPLVWVLARKNDLAATYDEGAAVDLARLNELSLPVHLVDFTPPEEQALLDRLSTEMGAKLSKELAEALLTFSAGFPWLLKRVCSHVLSMSRVGATQTELTRGGLRAEDLFDEDLAGLDEADKALLRVLAAHLPNNAGELSRRLEGEVSFKRLTVKLNDFLGRKLLRLSGDVYDTYNDVFKSYLLTGRIPFQARYVFRVTPGPALGLLTSIVEEGGADTATFARRLGGNATATYNKLRELRLLGILAPEVGKVRLSSEAEAALEADQMGSFLRQALRANALVSSVLDLISRSDSVDLRDVTLLLRSELPHIEASDNTWTSYASILINWLRYAGMVDVEGEHVKPRESASDELVLRRAFNLGNFATNVFVPSVRPGKVRELLEMLRDGGIPRAVARERLGPSQVGSVMRDARSLDLIEDDGAVVRATAQGRAILAQANPLQDRDVAVVCLSKPNVRGLLDAAAETPLSSEQQREVLSRYGSASWSDQTWAWRTGILTAWAVASGQAKGGRRGLRSGSGVEETQPRKTVRQSPATKVASAI
ncbi:hypothetical protein [Modestobacter sp. Leaf380]|uniref:nSTAND1 domain-containing NTPase n=1 Tax=Modestobacter sp. Leaf380 TaxID=1736356 RepID=UPI000A6DA363|nr:hypothetical protein [Modestobacter sp. Leaf380]